MWPLYRLPRHTDNISPHRQARLLRAIWKLNILHRRRTFALRLIIENLPTSYARRTQG